MKQILFTLIFFKLFKKEISITNLIDHPIEVVENGIKFRVINGKEAELGDIPYQIAFKKYRRIIDMFTTDCGGTLVSPIKVLTAAHCLSRDLKNLSKVKKKRLPPRMVVAGNLKNYDNSTADGQWRELKKVLIHPEFSFPNNDIAVAFVDKSFHLNTYVQAIRYARNFVDYKGECLASGYGRISNNIVGDSGGPLVCHTDSIPNEKKVHTGVLVGIASGVHFHRTFFTRVSSYTEFIEKNSGNRFIERYTVLKIVYFYFVVMD